MGICPVGICPVGICPGVFVLESVDTPHFTGITQDICLQDPLFDLVIGNIVGARKPKHSVLGEKTCAAAVGRV